MKIFCTMIALALLVAVPAMSQFSSDRLNDGIKGTVREITIKRAHCSMVNGKLVEAAPWIWQRRLYNDRGDVAESTTYDQKGVETSREIYTYDESGRRLSSRHLDHLAKLDLRRAYVYDSVGRVAREMSYRLPNDFLYSEREHTYDPQGRLVMQADYLSDGALVTKRTFLYRPDGSSTMTEERFNSNGTRWSVMELTRNASGVITQSDMRTSAGNIESRHVWTCDVYGNETEGIFYLPQREPTKGLYSYELDRFGNWTKRILYTIVKKNNAETREPVWAYYRTIAYYPDTASDLR